MAKADYIQSNFNSGVLDPALFGRLDVRHYFNGMKTGRNVVTLPQGGVRRRGGLPYLATLAQQISDIASTGTPTAPQGGTAGNANDNNDATLLTTTGNIGTVNPYIVVKIDFGAAKVIRFADVVAMKVTGGSTNEFQIQYSTDDVVWNTFDVALTTIDVTARTYRRGTAAITARYWRVAKIGGSDLGAVTAELAEFNLWQETGSISNRKGFKFAFNTSQRYLMIFTDQNIAIYQNDVLVQNVLSPYINAQILNIEAAQSADTMILTHEDVAPQKLVRGTSSVLWTLSTLVFTNIPQHDFNDGSSPTPVADTQDITFAGGAWVQGDTFKLDIEGALTEEITYAGSATANEKTATEENITRAVQKVYTVGFEGISVAFQSATIYRITLDQDSAKNYKLFSGIPVSVNATTSVITVAKNANGTPRTEAVWSTARGWPIAVTFFEGRLWFGGSKALPTSVFGSVVSDFFNFNIGAGLASDAIFGTLNTDQLNAIQAIFPGRDLQLFTTGGEFFFQTPEKEAITPENLRIRNQTKFGTAKIKPVNVDGATLFVQRTGKVVREFLFSLTEEAYNATPMTALAQHLVNNIVSMDAWEGSGTEDANYIYVVNTDGTVAVFNTLRSQEVAAWTEWTTDGLFKDVTVVEEDVYFVVQRVINGVTVEFLEKLDTSYYTDAAVQSNGNNPKITAVTGLDHLNGEVCRVRADGLALTSVTPVAGAATISNASTNIEIGLNFNPKVETMNLTMQAETGPTLLKRYRIVKVRALVKDTLGLLVNGDRISDRQLDVDTFDSAPPAFTGALEIETSSNWSFEPQTVTIEQSDPMPLHLQLLDIHMETEF